MEGKNISDIIGVKAVDEVSGSVAPDPGQQVKDEGISIGDFLGGFKDYLMAECPDDKSPEDYMNHALNFSKSKGVGRILWGVDGMFGVKNFALLNIVMGCMEYVKESKAGGHFGVR